MEDKELVFDREHHILYAKQCREEILNKISLHYSDEPSEKNFKKKACNFTLETSEIIMGWFNIYGLIIIAVIMIPNIVFAIKIQNGFENLWHNKIVETLEQIGRFGCFGLMIFNIPYTYIGFWFDNALAVYIIVCTVLVTAYCLIFQKKLLIQGGSTLGNSVCTFSVLRSNAVECTFNYYVTDFCTLSYINKR